MPLPGGDVSSSFPDINLLLSITAWGQCDVWCKVCSWGGGWVHMLYDVVLLFITTTGTAIIVGSLLMHTLHFFVENEFMTLTFSVIKASVFIGVFDGLQ